nr:hypothetical protein [Halorubrum salipaludis]
MGRALVKSLRATADRVRWGPPDRTEQFALFSKSGFTDGLEAELGDDWSLFGSDDIASLLTG